MHTHRDFRPSRNLVLGYRSIAEPTELPTPLLAVSGLSTTRCSSEAPHSATVAYDHRLHHHLRRVLSRRSPASTFWRGYCLNRVRHLQCKRLTGTRAADVIVYSLSFENPSDPSGSLPGTTIRLRRLGPFFAIARTRCRRRASRSLDSVRSLAIFKRSGFSTEAMMRWSSELLH